MVDGGRRLPRYGMGWVSFDRGWDRQVEEAAWGIRFRLRQEEDRSVNEMSAWGIAPPPVIIEDLVEGLVVGIRRVRSESWFQPETEISCCSS